MEIAWDKKVNLPRGFAYVEFEKHDEAEKARISMDGVSKMKGRKEGWEA